MEEKIADKIQYRIIFITGPTIHDVKSLREVGQELRFILTGQEKLDEVMEAVSSSLKDFDPGQDVIIPVGKVSVNLMIGVYLAKRFPGQRITFGVHKWDSPNGYAWKRVEV